MTELQKCLRFFALWRGCTPITFFLRNSGVLKIYKLADFQSPSLAKKATPRSGKTPCHYSDFFDLNTNVLFNEYKEVHQRDIYGQEKLAMLPIMIVDCLRNGRVDLAVQYSEENLNLHGGLSGLKKKLDSETTQTKVNCPAVVPAVNFLSLKLLRLRESSGVSWNEETEDLVSNYRLCLKGVGRSKGMEDVTEMVCDNFSQVMELAAQCDNRLLAENIAATSFSEKPSWRN